MLESRLGRIARFMLLLAFCGILFMAFPGARGLSSSQEGRAGIITRNMIRSGDYAKPYIKGDETKQKPAFFYWLTVASCRVFGINEMGVRFPCMLAAMICVVFSVLLAAGIYDWRTAFFSGYILATMAGFMHLARTARIDMVLTAFFTVAMYLFYIGYIRDRKANAWLYLFYAVLGVSVLAKGPVAVALAAFIVFFYAVKEKNLRILWEVKPVSGMIIGLLISSPWFLYANRESGGEFTKEFFLSHNIERFLGWKGTFGKRKTAFFYIPKLFANAAPWSILIPFGIYKLGRSWRKPRRDRGLIAYCILAVFVYFPGAVFKQWSRLRSETVFLLLWVIVIFIFFSAAAFKRGDYILPLFPALAILFSKYLCDLGEMKTTRLFKTACWSVFVFICTVSLSMIAFFISRLPDFLGEKITGGRIAHLNKSDAIRLMRISEFVTGNIILFIVGSALILVFLYFAVKALSRAEFMRFSTVLCSLLFISYCLWIFRLMPELARYNSYREFSLKSRSAMDSSSRVIFYKFWDLEAVFYFNCEYEKIWDDEKLRSVVRPGDHIVTDLEGLERLSFPEDISLKSSLSTVDGHEENVFFCTVKTRSFKNGAPADKRPPFPEP